MTRRKKAVVAMSGGVDSSVAAAMLVEEGYEVTGIMLKLWRGEAANSNSGCCNLDAATDARRVADVLGIPFYVLNFADRFERTVIEDFRSQYASGRTPNPCVRCNQWIKFDALLERARALGAGHLATGHYARVRNSGSKIRLLRGVDRGKDQSYVLWMLTQDELRHALFPVGELHKSETRSIARRLGLRTAAKPDSQEICFVRNGDTRSYVSAQIPTASVAGPLVDSSGRELGTHAGIGHYTVGQRKGLGVAVGHPLYVTAIDARSNTVVVGDRSELDVSSIEIEEVSYVGAPVRAGERVIVQHRAHGEVTRARVIAAGERGMKLEVDEPAASIAPGQSAAFYSADDPDELVGGGVIAATAPAAAAV